MSRTGRYSRQLSGLSGRPSRRVPVLCETAGVSRCGAQWINVDGLSGATPLVGLVQGSRVW